MEIPSSEMEAKYSCTGCGSSGGVTLIASRTVLFKAQGFRATEYHQDFL